MTAPHLEAWRSTTIGVARTPEPAGSHEDWDDETAWTDSGDVGEVPAHAAEVVAWIRYSDDADLSRARAEAAAEVEAKRDEPRKTVLAAIDAALDG